MKGARRVNENVRRMTECLYVINAYKFGKRGPSDPDTIRCHRFTHVVCANCQANRMIPGLTSDQPITLDTYHRHP